jgi:hypothetical protein
VKRIVALAAVAAAALAAGAGASPARVLGIDRFARTLGWYDPASLAPHGRSAPLGFHLCSWSFSPGRARVAVAGCNDAELRIVDLRTMRSAGDVRVSVGGSIDSLTWLRPDRVLALLRLPAATQVVAIDPIARRVVRRTPLPLSDANAHRLPDALVLLLTRGGGFAPAQLAVVDADGNVRLTTLDRIVVGRRIENGSDPQSTVRTAGFAVDPDGRRAYVVAPDLTIADVDLASLEVRYHAPPRTLAKVINGPERTAAWLGGGLLAVGGADYSTADDAQGRLTVTAKPVGVRVVDTRHWTARMVDADAGWFTVAGRTLLAEHDGMVVAYRPGGDERWRIALPPQTWLDVEGAYAYLCENGYIRRILDAATARTVRAFPQSSVRRCATLLR